jgi:hypothetical protein
VVKLGNPSIGVAPEPSSDVLNLRSPANDSQAKKPVPQKRAAARSKEAEDAPAKATRAKKVTEAPAKKKAVLSLDSEDEESGEESTASSKPTSKTKKAASQTKAKAKPASKAAASKPASKTSASKKRKASPSPEPEEEEQPAKRKKMKLGTAKPSAWVTADNDTSTFGLPLKLSPIKSTKK